MPAGPVPDGDVIQEMPHAAKQRTDEGAKAFVKYFIDVYNDAALRRRVGAVAALSSKSCQSCNKLEEFLWLLTREKVHLSEPPWAASVMLVSSPPGGVQNARIVSVRATQVGSDVINTDGVVIAKVPAETALLAFELTWSGRWKVSELTIRDEVAIKK